MVLVLVLPCWGVVVVLAGHVGTTTGRGPCPSPRQPSPSPRVLFIWRHQLVPQILLPLPPAPGEGEFEVAPGEGEEPHALGGGGDGATLVQVDNLLGGQTAGELGGLLQGGHAPVLALQDVHGVSKGHRATLALLEGVVVVLAGLVLPRNNLGGGGGGGGREDVNLTIIMKNFMQRFRMYRMEGNFRGV